MDATPLLSTKTALKMADYVITEAGFGADLGAEKFLDIKCRIWQNYIQMQLLSWQQSVH